MNQDNITKVMLPDGNFLLIDCRDDDWSVVHFVDNQLAAIHDIDRNAKPVQFPQEFFDSLKE